MSVLTSAKAADQISLEAEDARVSLLNAAQASDVGVDRAEKQIGNKLILASQTKNKLFL